MTGVDLTDPATIGPAHVPLNPFANCFNLTFAMSVDFPAAKLTRAT